jgi:RNA methyltransferase, TrmH family
VLGARCAGAWTPRVLRAAQGAHFSLRIREHAVLAELIRRYDGRTLAAVAHNGQSLYATDLRGSIAWLFGSEGQGVSPELLALADAAITIPSAGTSESLNVAAAAAVCLFESLRQRTSMTAP